MSSACMTCILCLVDVQYVVVINRCTVCANSTFSIFLIFNGRAVDMQCVIIFSMCVFGVRRICNF